MRFLLPMILLIGIFGCSREAPQATQPQAAKTERFDQFTVTLAIVKTPNNILAQHGCPMHGTNGYYFDSIEADREFAAYVLAHTNEFSFTTTTGNCVPVVNTFQQTNVRLVPDPNRENQDFEKYGMKTVKFQASVDVREVSDGGYLNSYSSCGCMVHLKEPLGGSYDVGINRPFLGPIIAVGTPEMTPMIVTKQSTVWALCVLNRDR